MASPLALLVNYLRLNVINLVETDLTRKQTINWRGARMSEQQENYKTDLSDRSQPSAVLPLNEIATGDALAHCSSCRLRASTAW
jgi:hypothetical protein